MVLVGIQALFAPWFSSLCEMGLKMPIRKQEDTVRFIAMGTAALSAPFLFGRAL